MPTYTYRCAECGTEFDLFHSISDTSTKSCPRCQAAAQKVVSGGIGVIFKGSGWYQTDYKGKNPAINGNGHHGHDHGDSCADCPHKTNSPEKKNPGKTDP